VASPGALGPAIRHAWLTDVICEVHAASRGTYFGTQTAKSRRATRRQQSGDRLERVGPSAVGRTSPPSDWA